MTSRMTSFKSTSTLDVDKTSLAEIPNSTTPAKKKPPHIDFPTSPHSMISEQDKLRNHFSHPQHPLVLASLSDSFTCKGCKEYGAGERFTCEICDFQLHLFCALAPATLSDHPFHPQHQLSFYSKPGGSPWSKCDICWKPAKGYIFRCSGCNFQMHPCCATLSDKMKFACHQHTINLLPFPMPIPTNGEPGFICGQCKRKRLGRVYRCGVCDYHLHAVCAKDMVNGLHTNGFKLEKPGMFGLAARLASEVVIHFIGGLIGGLGEGVGQMLIQTVAKGRRSFSRKTSRTD